MAALLSSSATAVALLLGALPSHLLVCQVPTVSRGSVTRGFAALLIRRLARWIRLAIG